MPDALPLPLILLVEDNPDLRALATDLFELSGYRVAVADGLQAAIAAFEQVAPSLVLTDVKLPDGSGLALLQHVRAHPGRPTVPVVLMSGDRQLSAGVPGASGFVDKPFEAAALLDLVEGLIQKQAMRA